MAAKEKPRGATPAPDAEPKPGEKREIAVLPVRHTVLFPLAILPLNVGRPANVQLVNDVMAGDRTLVVCAQKDAANEEPGPGDLHPIGTLGVVLRMARGSDNHLAVLVQGIARVRLGRPIAHEKPWMKFEVEVVAEI